MFRGCGLGMLGCLALRGLGMFRVWGCLGFRGLGVRG